MYIPAFLFESEDISALKDERVFLGELTHKKSGFKYFKLDLSRFNRLIDIMYSNGIFEDEDKSDLEFSIRALALIFTNIIDGEYQRDIMLSNILQYSRISKNNAKLLMTMI